MRKIGIIGSGSWGNALAQVYSIGFDVTMYPRSSDKSTLEKCSYIFIVVPAQELSKLCKEIQEYVSINTPIIICSKGIEISTCRLPSEIVDEYFPKNMIAVLSGPNFSEEIRKGMPAVTSLAVKSLKMAKSLSKAVYVKNFKLIPTNEIDAVQVFGALKNVLAILGGFAQGLGFGENERAALLTQGIKEISDFARERSNKKAVCITNPGCIGDVILTCTSVTSRNTKFGMELAKIYKASEKSESLITLKETIEGNFTAQALSKLDIKVYPLLKFSNCIIGDGLNDKAGTIKKFKQLIFE